MISVDLLSIGTAVHNAIANARRAGAEKAARDEVQRARDYYRALGYTFTG